MATREARQVARREAHRQATAAARARLSIEPSHRRKLGWAESHIQDIEALIADWRGYGYRVFVQPNRNGLSMVYAEMVEPLPEELPLIVGDALHALRDSLDHIIFALSKKNPLMATPKDEQSPSFPIYDVAVHMKSPAIQFLSWEATAQVVDLAPDPARQPNNQHPLWLLDKVNNRDKHREMVFRPRPDPSTAIGISASDGSDYFRTFGGQALQMGAGAVPLVEFRRSPNVKAEIRPTVEIVFDQGVEVAGREVISTLRQFHDHIRDTVFQRLEPYL
jgi:hypothetical protein